MVRVKEAAASVWELGGLTPLQLVKRSWKELNDDDVWGRAAELSYYFLFALFPLLLFMTSVFGFILGENSQMRHELLAYLHRVLPGSASELVSKTVNEVTGASGAGKLSFGLLTALWAASNGMGALIKTMNIAYDVDESRPWWRVRLRAIFMTIGLAILVLSALSLVLFGGQMAEWVSGQIGAGGAAFLVAWNVVRWAGVIAFVLFSYAMVYYFAPDVREQRWYWITPGSIVGGLLWLAASAVFKVYLMYFDNYSATYGSLGAVIVLMLWFYVTGLAMLIGAEVNSEIEHAAAERGHPEAKLPGEKAA